MNCSRFFDDVFCVFCVNGRCFFLYDCNVVIGGCRGFFDCKYLFIDFFCNISKYLLFGFVLFMYEFSFVYV